MNRHVRSADGQCKRLAGGGDDVELSFDVLDSTGSAPRLFAGPDFDEADSPHDELKNWRAADWLTRSVAIPA